MRGSILFDSRIRQDRCYYGGVMGRHIEPDSVRQLEKRHKKYLADGKPKEKRICSKCKREFQPLTKYTFRCDKCKQFAKNRFGRFVGGVNFLREG